MAAINNILQDPSFLSGTEDVQITIYSDTWVENFEIGKGLKKKKKRTQTISIYSAFPQYFHCPSVQWLIVLAHNYSSCLHTQSTSSRHAARHRSAPVPRLPLLIKESSIFFYNAHQQSYFLHRLHGDVHRYLSVKREVLLVLGKPVSWCYWLSKNFRHQQRRGVDGTFPARPQGRKTDSLLTQPAGGPSGHPHTRPARPGLRPAARAAPPGVTAGRPLAAARAPSRAAASAGDPRERDEPRPKRAREPPLAASGQRFPPRPSHVSFADLSGIHGRANAHR